MKRTSIIIIGALALAACTTPKSDSFELEAKIDGLKADIVYIRYMVNPDSLVTDSAKVTDDRFNFEGKVEDPTLARLMTKDNSVMITFYLENEKLVLSGSADSIENITVAGSKAHEDYETLQEALSEVNAKNKELSESYRKARKDKDTLAMEAIQKKYEGLKLNDKRLKITEQFVRKHPNSYVSLDQMGQLAYSRGHDELNGMFKGLNASIQNSGKGREFAERLKIMEKTSIGKIAPDFTQENVDGEPVSLSGLRGKYVLIDFWAAWCGPCRGENPNVVAAYNKYKKNGFTVLGVSLDSKKENWLKAIEDDSLQWIQLSDLKGWKNEVAQKYGVRAIPANYLLNPEGMIVGKDLRGEALHKKLEELL